MKTWILFLGGLCLFNLRAWSLEQKPTTSIDVEKDKSDKRRGKLLPIMQVVRFPNDVCSGSTRNGTCYTGEECSNRGGTSGGSCASGFGVCCIFTLSCGGTTSDNSSYLVQTAATTVTPSPCDYTVCPLNNNICRIRYDFTTFVITGSTVSASSVVADVAAPSTKDGMIGHCITDSFEVTAPGSIGSPVICGTNSGYHSKYLNMS